MSRRAWWLYIAVLAAGVPVYFLVTEGTAQRFLYYAYGFSSVAAIACGIRMHRPAHRGLWLAFAGGLFLFAAGDIAFDAYQNLGVRIPVPSIADGLYLAAYPVLAWGIVVLVRRRTGGRDLVSALDGVMVASGGAVLAWVFIMSPYAVDRTLGVAARVVPISYPALDLLLLALLARLMLGGGARSPSYRLLVSSVVALLIADVAFAFATLHNTYRSGTVIDLGWLVSYALWGAAALHPSMAQVTSAAQPRKIRADKVTLIVLALASLTAPAVLVVQDLRGADVDVSLLAVMSATMFVLVLIRVGIMSQALDVYRERSRAAASAEDRQRVHNERRFQSLVQHSSDIVTLVDSDRLITYVSPSVEAILGHHPDEMVGRPIAALVNRDDRDAMAAKLNQVLADGLGASAVLECQVRHADGSWRDSETVVTNLLDDPDVRAIVLNGRDVTARHALERDLHRQAFHDSLTGLANRALFADRVAHALSRRDRDATVAVLFIDLDDFKTVNDSRGHPAGDQLLVAVAERLNSATRPDDTVARLGGDEFAVLLESGRMPAAPKEVARRMAQALLATFRLGDEEVTVRASIGIAIGRPGDDQPEDLLRDADLAMYMAKRNGKDRYELYDRAMHEDAVRRLEVSADLRRAIEGQQFEVFYQPIVDVTHMTAIGFEAVVRWHHPRRGMVWPAEFVGIAESTGLILPLGAWVLAEACHQTQLWRQTRPGDEGLYVSVNLSARQLQDPDLIDEVTSTLRRSGLPPSALVLEVTESSIMQDLDTALSSLHALKALGLRLAIDDFGTGYSSLSYLRNLPVDIVKIDKSFVDRLLQPEGKAMVRSVIELSRALGLTTIAEGVEQQDQLDLLVELGCDHVQGFIFAKPTPASETLDAVDRIGLDATLRLPPAHAPA